VKNEETLDPSFFSSEWLQKTSEVNDLFFVIVSWQKGKKIMCPLFDKLSKRCHNY
jgi:hypothetical protein